MKIDKNLLNKQLKIIRCDINKSVKLALKEDLDGIINHTKDITSMLIPRKKLSKAEIFSKEKGTFCGKKWLEEVYKQLEKNIKIKWYISDGEEIIKNQTICHILGSTRILLTGERTALNFIQTLCGVSTKVKKYIKQIKNTNVKLLDTRKTIPGIRTALKYAVLCGCGNNHRYGLTEIFLIKENHISAIGSIANAVKIAKKTNNKIPIEIEVENLYEFKEALKTQVDIIMLDNFKYKDILNAVLINNKKKKIEISGNINYQNIRKFALTGIDYISVGDLTKNITALDLSMKIINT